MKTYSTREAAKMLGIGMMTLNRHIAAGKVTVPPVQNIGGNRFRAWTLRDVERVRKMLPKIKNGRKHRKKRERKNEDTAKFESGTPKRI